MASYSSLRLFPIAALVVCALVFAPPVALAGQAYMQAVEAEVEEFSSGSFDLPAGSPWTSSPTVLAGSTAASGDFDEFNMFFRKKLPGTYIRYRQLPQSVKMQIYQEYVKTGDLSKVRSRVLETVRR